MTIAGPAPTTTAVVRKASTSTGTKPRQGPTGPATSVEPRGLMDLIPRPRKMSPKQRRRYRAYLAAPQPRDSRGRWVRKRPFFRPKFPIGIRCYAKPYAVL